MCIVYQRPAVYIYLNLALQFEHDQHPEGRQNQIGNLKPRAETSTLIADYIGQDSIEFVHISSSPFLTIAWSSALKRKISQISWQILPVDFDHGP